MPPAKKDLLIYKGDSFQLFIRIRSKIVNPETKQVVNGPGKDLTGMTVRACIKGSAGAPEKLAEFKATILDQAIEDNRGCVMLELSPKQTDLLPASVSFPSPQLVYDVRVQSEGDDPDFAKTYIAGGIAVQGGVS